MKEENIIYRFFRDLLEVLEDVFLVLIVGPILKLIDIFSKKKPEKESRGDIFLREQREILDKIKNKK